MVDRPGSVCRTADQELDELLEEFTLRLSAGEAIDIDAFVAAHSAHAEPLQRLLPAMEALVVFGHTQVTSSIGRAGISLAPSQQSGVLGDFRIVREIGRGGMGVVYEAEQISIGRTVALKVLPFAAMLDERHLARFRNEVRAAGQLHHSNIVPVYLVGCERGVHYYAMQLVAGQSLAESIANLRRIREQTNHHMARNAPGDQSPELDLEPSEKSAHQSLTSSDTVRLAMSTLPDHSDFSYRTVAQLGIQAAEALEHAHAHGVIHRDIKPGNLIVDACGHLWVTDFGLAHIESDTELTITGDVLGTLRYMSPEQTRGVRAVLDGRTDVYSLGATLYETLALKPAFDGADRQQLLQQISQEEPRSLRRIDAAIPVDLETIIGKAMAKDVDQRYQTAGELAADLRRFVSHEQILARPPSLFDKCQKWLRRHAAVVKVAVAALVLISVIGMVASLSTLAAYRSEAQQRAAAEENLLVAAESVDRMLARVAGSRFSYGDLTDAEKITSDAASLYDQLLRTSDSPELTLRAARAYRQVAHIRGTLMQDAAVERARSRAVELLTRLTQAYSEQAEYLDALAEAQLAHGEALWALDQGKRAETAFQQGLANCERLVEQFPQKAAYQVRLMHALQLLGMWHAATGRSAEAEVLLRRETAIGANLPTNISDLPESQSLQAIALHNFATRACQQRDYKRAIVALEQAITLQECAHLGWPTNSSFVDHLSDHYTLLAEAYLLCGDAERAAAAVERMISAIPEDLRSYHHGADLLIRCARAKQSQAAAHPEKSDVDPDTTPEDASDAFRKRAKELLGLTAAARIRTPQSVHAFARFLLSCSDESFRNASYALELTESLVTRSPERASYWFTKALAHYRLGELDRADFELDKAMTYARDGQPNAEDLLLLFLVRQSQGRNDSANQAYTKAQSLMNGGTVRNDVLESLSAEATCWCNTDEPIAPCRYNFHR